MHARLFTTPHRTIPVVIATVLDFLEIPARAVLPHHYRTGTTIYRGLSVNGDTRKNVGVTPPPLFRFIRR